MKKISKRVMTGILSLALVGVLAGCNTTNNSDSVMETPTNVSTEYSKQVVATIDGVDITRETIGESLTSAETSAISDYIYNQMLEKFFADVTVTDEEVTLQLELMKKQVGEENWTMYLAYYGGGSEETFKQTLKQNLKQEKRISELSENLTITDEDLQSAYNEDNNAYNIAVLNVIFFDSAEELAKATTLVTEGKSLSDIATEMGKEVSKNEHTYFNMEGWNKDFSSAAIGEIMYTNSESGNFVVGEVVELNIGVSNEKVKEDMTTTMKRDKGYEALEKEYSEFLKKSKASIMGVDFPLYEEPTENIEDNTSNIVVPETK